MPSWEGILSLSLMGHQSPPSMCQLFAGVYLRAHLCLCRRCGLLISPLQKLIWHLPPPQEIAARARMFQYSLRIMIRHYVILLTNELEFGSKLVKTMSHVSICKFVSRFIPVLIAALEDTKTQLRPSAVPRVPPRETKFRERRSTIPRLRFPLW